MLSQVLLDQLSLMLDILRKSKSWKEIQEIFLQVNQVILYFYEQKKKSPYTSIREEHIKITIEFIGETKNILEWMGKPEEIRFMVSG
jgi:stage III sporulation protein SpoIIIAA